MRIQSPLSNLSEILQQVHASASQYEQTLRKNEAATRAVLIDPILRALGWDTANTYMVEVEKTLSKTRVDYALYDSNADVKVIIEAKPLGDDLSHPEIMMNLVKYAFTFELQDIFLTDGLVWQHFTNFTPGNVNPSKVIQLAEDNPVESAGYLVQRLDAAKFWPEVQTIDTLAQQVAQLESAFSNLYQEMRQIKASGLQQKLHPQSERQVEVANKNIEEEIFIPLEELAEVAGTKPTALKLPDGTEIPIRSWSGLLRETCKYVLRKNPSIQIPLPDRSGKKQYLLSKSRPAKGPAYVEESYNGETIFIYTNYSANKCILNSLYILDLLQESEQRRKIAVELKKSDVD